MNKICQRTVEYFFNKHKIKDPDQKAKILPGVTPIIYDYNMLVIEYEKKQNNDEYAKQQIINDLKEVESKIDECIKEQGGAGY